MKIGLSLYSVRDYLNKDLPGTLEIIAKVGYTEMEFASHSMSEETMAAYPPKEIRRIVSDLGLNCLTNHINAMGEVDWKRIAEFNAELGVKGIVLPFGFMSTREETLQLAEMCNNAALVCKEYGLTFYYHNHFQEFYLLDGQPAFDLFLSRTDPELVQVELDTFWVQRGGQDPVSTMKRYGKRCGLIHQKDMGKDTDPVNLFSVVKDAPSKEKLFGFMGQYVKASDFTEIGTGTMDVASIVRAANEIGSSCIIVEQDQISMDVMESLTISYKNLKALV